MGVSIPFHIYECTECIVSFAVEMTFEDQSCVNCPVCLLDEHIQEVGSGEMTLKEVSEE